MISISRPGSWVSGMWNCCYYASLTTKANTEIVYPKNGVER